MKKVSNEMPEFITTTTYRLINWDFDFVWDLLFYGVRYFHFLVDWVRFWDFNGVLKNKNNIIYKISKSAKIITYRLIYWNLNFIGNLLDDVIWFWHLNLLFNCVWDLLDHLIGLGNVFFNGVWDLLDYFIRFWDENFDGVGLVNGDLHFIRDFFDL